MVPDGYPARLRTLLHHGATELAVNRTHAPRDVSRPLKLHAPVSNALLPLETGKYECGDGCSFCGPDLGSRSDLLAPMANSPIGEGGAWLL